MARKGHVDELLKFVRATIKHDADKNFRFSIQCNNCSKQYGTSVQNERKKTQQWICGHCILSKRKLTDEQRKRLSEFANRPLNLEKNRNRNSGENNPFFGKKHTENSLLKMRGRVLSLEKRKEQSLRVSLEIAQGKRHSHPTGKRSWYVSLKTGEVNHADSTFELKRMRFLDTHPEVESWTKNHGIIIEWGHEQRRYIPDFLVCLSNGVVFLEEIKGWVRHPTEFEQKNKAAEEYASRNGMTFRVLFGDSLENL